MTADDAAAPQVPQMRPLGPLIPAAELDIWQDAAEARSLAERHLRRVRSWARAAYQRERARGRAEGRNAGGQEMAQLIARAAAELARRKAELGRELPELVMEIVSDLLGAFDPGDMLVRVVNHAIEQKCGSAEVHLRVSPEQADALAREFATYDGREGRPELRIDADPALRPGQCVLWSEFGNIDLSLASQLRALRSGFGLACEEIGL